MARLSHGSVILLDQVNGGPEDLHALAGPNPDPTLVPCPELTGYDYLFDDLQANAANRLPELPNTAISLIALGNAMKDSDPLESNFDSMIPSIYTYFGQFITHDITLEGVTQQRPLDANIRPLTSQEIRTLKNTRTARLDLDSVYGPMIDKQGNCHSVPRKGDEMAVARAYRNGLEGSDLPRNPSDNSSARIGDPRNDENLITSQLHLAFLRAHNLLVRRGATYQQAQVLMRKHYQWIVTHDFLPKIADSAIVSSASLIREHSSSFVAKFFFIK